MSALKQKTIESTRRVSRVRARRRHARGGAAAVEAAFCMTFILIPLMMGTLEVCSGIYLQESLTVCAYEGVRAGIGRRSTAEDVQARVALALEDRNIVIADDVAGVVITPSNFDSLNALDPVTVTITVRTAGNSLFIFDTVWNRDVSASVTMVREFDE